MILRRALYLALFGLPTIAVADTRTVRVFDADRVFANGFEPRRRPGRMRRGLVAGNAGAGGPISTGAAR
jgi:hypothetical protein